MCRIDFVVSDSPLPFIHICSIVSSAALMYNPQRINNESHKTLTIWSSYNEHPQKLYVDRRERHCLFSQQCRRLEKEWADNEIADAAILDVKLKASLILIW